MSTSDFDLSQSSSKVDFTQKVSIDFSSPSSFVYTLGKWFLSFQTMFLILAIFQGFFSGLVLGKLASGSAKQGLKHSVILSVLAFMAVTVAQALLG